MRSKWTFKRKATRLAGLFAVLLCLLLGGCVLAPVPIDPAPPLATATPIPIAATEEPMPTTTPVPTPKPTPLPTPTPNPVDARIAQMSDGELLAQMIMLGFYGDTEPDALTASMLQEGRVENLIFFARNVKDVETLRALSAALQQMSASNLPMFMAVDEEGGRVSRLPYEDRTPAARVLGDGQDILAAYNAGKLIAQRMQECGMNLDFAPVLDIQTNPENTVIGNRAFGTDSATVTDMALSMYRGLSGGGVVAVGKHFPGHGDTFADSHRELPRVSADLERLRSVEMRPFAAAVRAGVPAILAGHILLQQVDPQWPCSLSSVFLQDILRGELGFEGMIVTDDMTMGAVLTQYDLGEACVRAVEAGCDLIVICHEDGHRREAVEALEEAVRTGRISRERLEESARRILKIKMDLGR